VKWVFTLVSACAVALAATASALTEDEAVALLATGTVEEQYEAAEFLGAAGDAAAVEPLVAALGDEDAALRQRAAMALGELASPEAIPALISALGDRDRAVQWFAATSLAKIGTPAVEPLIAELHRDERDAVVGAVMALGRMRAERAVGPLVTLLSAPDLYVREHAVEALVAIGRPAVRPLIAAATSAEPVTKKGAVVALGRLADAAAAETLVGLLGDADLVARHYAVVALRQPGPAAYDALEGALASHDPAVQKAACDILGYVRDHRAIKPVAALLTDDHESVRWYAAKTLGAIDGKFAVENLIAALDDASPRVREVAILALGRIRAFEAVPALKDVAANDVDEGVRAAATEALAAIAGRE